MGGGAERFERIRRAHARLRGAEVAETSVVLVPLGADAAVRLLEAGAPETQAKLWAVRPLRLRHPAAAAKHGDESRANKHDAVAPSADEPAPRHASLSAHFGRLHPIKPGAETAGHRRPRRLPQHPPDVKVSPQALETEVELFPSCAFTHHSPAAETVKVIWDGRATGHALMERDGAGCYRASVLLDEGSYLFAYDADGALLPPGSHAQSLRLRGDGVFATLKLRRPALTLTLSNGGPEAEIVSLKSEVPWLAGGVVTLPSGRRTRVAVEVLPGHLRPGANEGELRVLVRRVAGLEDVASVAIKLRGVARGVIPSLECERPEAAEVVRGAGALRFAVNVLARGSGTLTGELLLPQTGDHVPFRLEGGAGEASFRHVFVVPGERLPPRTDGSLKVLLVSDSYLANRRVLRAEVPYRAVYLKKSLPALLFEKLPAGGARTLRLAVRRSDEGALDLQAAIPRHAAAYLTVSRAGVHALSFHLDAGQLRPGTIISDVVTLTDRSSGLQERIKVSAEVTGA